MQAVLRAPVWRCQFVCQWVRGVVDSTKQRLLVESTTPDPLAHRWRGLEPGRGGGSPFLAERFEVPDPPLGVNILSSLPK